MKFQRLRNAAITVPGRAIVALGDLGGDGDLGIGHQRLEVRPEGPTRLEIPPDVENVPLRQVGRADREAERLGHIFHIGPRVLFVTGRDRDRASDHRPLDPLLHKLRRTAEVPWTIDDRGAQRQMIDLEGVKIVFRSFRQRPKSAIPCLQIIQQSSQITQ